MIKFSNKALEVAPKFINYEPLLLQHRKRLYTKDKVFYSQFAKCGETQVNMYIIKEGEHYFKVLTENGKKSISDITEEINRL